jgi:hypothetical protein
VDRPNTSGFHSEKSTVLRSLRESPVSQSLATSLECRLMFPADEQVLCKLKLRHPRACSDTFL